jgi:EpsI family protein
MKRAGWDYFLMIAVLAGAASLSVMVRHGQAVPLRKSFAEFPLRIGDWTGKSLGEFPEGILKVLNVSDYMTRDYTRGSDQVSLYVGYYQQQRAGESIHSPKNCLPGGGWEVLDSRQGALDIPSQHKSIQVNYYVVQNEQYKQFVLYWYDTHGRAFASEYEGKAILVWEALKTGRTDGAMIRVMVPYTGSTNRAEATSQEFARLIYPLLKEYLPE